MSPLFPQIETSLIHINMIQTYCKTICLSFYYDEKHGYWLCMTVTLIRSRLPQRAHAHTHLLQLDVLNENSNVHI